MLEIVIHNLQHISCPTLPQHILGKQLGDTIIASLTVDATW